MVLPTGHVPIHYTVNNELRMNDALQVVVNKIEKESRTLQCYDAMAGLVTAIGPSQVIAANVISAGIGRGYTKLHPIAASTAHAWFNAHLAIAQRIWGGALPASLLLADPTVVGGPYDALAEFWFEFADHRAQCGSNGNTLLHQNGRKLSYVGETQINKVLYLVYPNLFPIFDSVLRRRTYAGVFQANCQGILKARGGVNVGNHKDGFRWEPFRQDLKANTRAGAFTAIRVGLNLMGAAGQTTRLHSGSLIPTAFVNGTTVDIYGWAAAHLTDNRLMDFLAL